MTGTTMRGQWLDQIADSYIGEHRQRAAAELAYFRDLPTDEDAISKAALARMPDAKLHPHQYRIPKIALKESESRLVANVPLLRSATSFAELVEIVKTIAGSISGIAELTIYDIALRIGARIGLEPTKVYLHRGTRSGAAAIGLNTSGSTVELTALPIELQVLTAREAEDALCIYKHQLAQIAHGDRPDLQSVPDCGPSRRTRRRRTC
jgi:hypothetical protein